MSRGRSFGVLIVGINYAPEHAGIAPYTTGLAEHLVAIGHEVTVLTGVPHYPAWTVGPGFERRLSIVERRNGVRIIHRAIYMPRRQTALQRAAYEGSFLASGIATTLIRRPDAVLGVVPSLSGGVLARLAAARYRTRYGVLFQDLMSHGAAQSGIAGGQRVVAATRRAERFVVARARAVAAVSPMFLNALAALGVPSDRVWYVPNWAHVRPSAQDAAERQRTRARLGWRDDEVVILHAGNMGLKQGLGQVVEAAARASGPPVRSKALRFVLMGDGSQRAALEEQVAATRANNVAFLRPEPAESFMDVLDAADVLLVTERASVRDMALPSKLTSYALAGRPVIAAVDPDGATATEVRRAGNGLVVPAEAPDQLLQAIDTLTADPALAKAMASAGVAYAHGALTPHAGLARAARFVAAIADGHGRPAQREDSIRTAMGLEREGAAR